MGLGQIALHTREKIAEVMSRITSPADGPNSIVPMSTGTSAMSYSRNGAEGKSGNLMK